LEVHDALLQTHHPGLRKSGLLLYVPLGNILMGNHSSIKTKELAAVIASQIQADWSVQ
jgi:hypothetical protein